MFHQANSQTHPPPRQREMRQMANCYRCDRSDKCSDEYQQFVMYGHYRCSYSEKLDMPKEKPKAEVEGE